jgi:hypothetical protein
MRFHDLRHTHASLLIADGAPIKVVSERLGLGTPGRSGPRYREIVVGVLVLSCGDPEDYASMRSDRVRIVATDVLVRQRVDVIAGGLAVDGVDEVPTDFGPVPRVVSGVDEHGHARIARKVLDPLTLWLGVHEDVLAVGVDPGEQRLWLAGGHEGHDCREVWTLRETNDVGVQGHRASGILSSLWSVSRGR